MTIHANPGRGRAKGFTLVEVVVALSLLSLLMLGLLAALRTFGDTLSRTDDKAEAVDAMWAVSRLLRDTIATAVPVQDTAVSATTQASLVFHGGKNELRWIGVMPARYGAGGLYHMRLLMDRSQPAPALLFEYLPYMGATHGAEWFAASRHRLIENVRDLWFQYQSQDEAEWGDSWVEAGRLPARVRVTIDSGSDTMAWPSLVIALQSSVAVPGLARRGASR